MAKRKTTKRQAKPSNKDDSKLFAFLATFLSIVGFIIAIVFRNKDDYVKFYAKQSLIAFITIAVLSALVQLVIPFGIVGGIVNIAVSVICLILWVLSWVYAISGEKKILPLIGQYGEKLPF